MTTRLGNIKFKKGLVSKQRKVTGKIDLKLSKLPLNDIAQIFNAT